MLSRIINKISNYFFVRFEVYIANKQSKELKKIISEFKNVGKKFSIGKDYSILNPKYIEIGDSFSAKERFRIEAWDKFQNQLFTPNIKIGNNVIFNTDIHIGCINSIVIGNNCLFASRIYITDHDHGDTTIQSLNTAPSLRPLQTKGPVIIEDNVWVGEGVAILAGVTVGKNSIIATNAVVTKNVPPNTVVAGIPAKVIKLMSND